MAQALTFTSDFKLGHYMKVPPRVMFLAQVIATVVAGTVQLGVQAWMFTNIEYDSVLFGMYSTIDHCCREMCSPDQTNQ
jgi:hypothetical protein